MESDGLLQPVRSVQTHWWRECAQAAGFGGGVVEPGDQQEADRTTNLKAADVSRGAASSWEFITFADWQAMSQHSSIEWGDFAGTPSSDEVDFSP